MDANLLKGQRVVVVGASSGIGLAVAQHAAKAGADVVMVSRSIDKLREAAAVVQGSPELVALDMLDAAGVRVTFAKLGPVDHLVLTAVADENKRRGPVHELTDDQFERSVDKLRGFFHVVRALSPTMTERGSITLTSGGSALKPPRQGMSVLAAVNASVIAFGHALALELAPRRVNVVTPGVVDTSVWAPADRERIRAWAESADLPARRFGQPADIAQAMLLLMTNPYVTGHNLVVDGGLAAS
jgi:NAD(P)-dependent dehydrogenase (short-subunit alcohol dehydrogenase family)